MRCRLADAVGLDPHRLARELRWRRLRACTALGSLCLALLACGDAGARKRPSAGADPADVAANRAGAQKTPFAAPTVETAAVRSGVLGQRIGLAGQLRSGAGIQLRPEMDGTIDRIRFSEGRRVQRGELLISLRADEQQARARVAEANLAVAEDAARRLGELAQQNIVAQTQLLKAQADVQVARAQLDIARAILRKAEIRAPFDGTVGDRLVDEGDRVETSTPLARLDATDRLQLTFAEPETLVNLIPLGSRVRFSLAPYPGELFEAEVFFLAPTLDPATRQRHVKAWAENPDGRLLPGQFASVFVDVPGAESLIVPEEAVVSDARGSFVWSVSAESTVHRRSVTKGASHDGSVEVRGELVAGERVVTAGAHKVGEAMPVRAVQSIRSRTSLSTQQDGTPR